METRPHCKAKQTKKLPRGFQLSGVKANIKYKNRLDLALIYSDTPCRSAGVWTQNSVQAACITHNKAHIENDIHAVLVNAGCANACTGEKGDENCKLSAQALAKALCIDSKGILLASTGVIGAQLPMTRIIKALPKLVAQKSKKQDSIKAASRAIMTTDTYAKTFGISSPFAPQECDKEQVTTDSKQTDNTATRDLQNECQTKCQTGGKKDFRVWGMAKGSGMIHPNMATMLGFILTDIAIRKDLLQEALREVVHESFNQISVDGDTSTNDMVVLLANGEAKNEEITTKDSNYELFKSSLKKVCIYLAKKIARDGEGATHLLEVSIKNAQSTQQARALSKAIIGSNLVKTAIFGKDANWGRIICAMGYSNTAFNSSTFDLIFASKKGKITIVENGVGRAFNEAKAKHILSADTIRIVIDLKDGACSAKAWGCDLSYDYIKINADYRS